MNDSTMNSKLDLIKRRATELSWPCDTIALDTALGHLDILIHDVRLLIDEEWRALREVAFMSRQEGVMRKEPSTLEDLI
jgi:hypothetical protein